jgi:hypothetical protein
MCTHLLKINRPCEGDGPAGLAYVKYANDMPL